MYINKLIYIFAGLFLILSLGGCYTNQNTPQTAADASAKTQTSASADTQNIENNGTNPGAVTLKLSDIPEFAARVTWPAFDATTAQKPEYIIKSGVEDGVWVEAKGYFKRSLEDVYKDLIDVQIMGPTYMTKDIVQKELVQNPVLTTYNMDIKLKYIMTVEFSLGVRIEALYGEDDAIGGYKYNSSKLSGTSFITTIDEQIVIRSIDNGWISVEFKSLNEATMNKENETRKHIESLFERWAS